MSLIYYSNKKCQFILWYIHQSHDLSYIVKRMCTSFGRRILLKNQLGGLLSVHPLNRPSPIPQTLWPCSPDTICHKAE